MLQLVCASGDEEREQSRAERSESETKRMQCEMLGPGARVASRPGGALHQWLSLLEA